MKITLWPSTVPTATLLRKFTVTSSPRNLSPPQKSLPVLACYIVFHKAPEFSFPFEISIPHMHFPQAWFRFMDFSGNSLTAGTIAILRVAMLHLEAEICFCNFTPSPSIHSALLGPYPQISIPSLTELVPSLSPPPPGMALPLSLSQLCPSHI